jgi:hypothetical protein
MTRATLADSAAPVTLIAPSGAETRVTLAEDSPGLWRARAPASEQGLYEARDGALHAFAAVGPLNPREAASVAATPDILRPVAQASGGGVFLTGEDGRNLPNVRRVGAGDRAAGNDWLGIERNASYVVRTAVAQPLGPAWAWAFAGVALFMLGWRREAR